MEFVFYKTLAAVKTFFGVPISFLRFIAIIGGAIFMLDIKAGLIVTVGLFFISKTIFMFVKDKEIVEVYLSNVENPKKIGF